MGSGGACATKKSLFEEAPPLQPGNSLVLACPLPTLGSVSGLGRLEHRPHPSVLSRTGWELQERPCRGQGAAFHMKRKRKGLVGRSHAINKRDSCSALTQPKRLGCSKSRMSGSANISSEVSKLKAFPCRQVQPWVNNSPDDFGEPQPGLRWL